MRKALFLSVAILMPTSGFAQEASESSEDIIVTAGKRDQALSDVSASVAAIDQGQLELIGAQDANALLGRIAGLSIETSQPGFARYVIRGVNAGGQFGWRQGSATAIYLGDTPLTTRANFFFASPDVNLFDMQRIEVLRGPQGTLYGAGAIGGAIRAIPNRADPFEFAARADGELSSTQDSGSPNYALRGMINVPLAGDRAALRLVADYNRQEGFIDAILLRTQDYVAEEPNAPRIRDYNDSERLNLRASAFVRLSDNVTAEPSLVFMRNRAGGAGDFALNTLGRRDRATVFASNPAFDASGRAYEFVDDQLLIGSLNLTASLDIFGGVDLVSATAYQARDADARDDTVASNGSWVVGFGFDDTYTGLDPSFAEFGTNVRQFTQELRLVTTGDQPLQFVAGLYFGRLRQVDDILYSFEGSPQAVLNNYGVVAVESYVGRDRFRETEYAAFLNADYRLTDQITASAGARLTRYDQSLSRGAAFPAFADPGDLANPAQLEARETKITPRFALTYRSNGGWLVYASAAEGFRTGGGNPPENLRGTCPNRASLPEQPDQFGADSAWSYEVGARGNVANGRLRFGAAAYRVDWTDIQTSVLFTCNDNSVVSFVDNAGRARVEGLELEATAALSPSLSLTGSLAYTRDRFIEDAPEAGKAKGDPLGFVPEWTANIGINYAATAPAFGSWRPYAAADYRYVSVRDDPNYGVRANPDFGEDLPAQNIVDARIGVRSERLDVSLFVRNLTNADVALSQLALFATNAFRPTGIDARSQRDEVVLRPRTFGMTARMNF
jgi:outer membrane receptor protein involved in Fe transport